MTVETLKKHKNSSNISSESNDVKVDVEESKIGNELAARIFNGTIEEVMEIERVHNVLI